MESIHTGSRKINASNIIEQKRQLMEDLKNVAHLVTFSDSGSYSFQINKHHFEIASDVNRIETYVFHGIEEDDKDEFDMVLYSIITITDHVFELGINERFQAECEKICLLLS